MAQKKDPIFPATETPGTDVLLCWDSQLLRHEYVFTLIEYPISVNANCDFFHIIFRNLLLYSFQMFIALHPREIFVREAAGGRVTDYSYHVIKLISHAPRDRLFANGQAFLTTGF